MKKFLFLGIAATAMFASCTNDEMVEMNPQSAIGFETFVDVDQEVKKGDLLLKFDIDLVKEKGYSTETMMSFELADKRTLQMQYTGQTQGKDVVAVVK